LFPYTTLFRSDIPRPDVLASGHDEVVEPPVHVKPAVAGDAPGVTRGQPAVRGQAGGGSVPVAAQQRWPAQLDLAALADPHGDAGEGQPVVDDPPTALGEPVGD